MLHTSVYASHVVLFIALPWTSGTQHPPHLSAMRRNHGNMYLLFRFSRSHNIPFACFHISPSPCLHTGRSAFLLAPETFSNAAAIYGPTTGTLLTNPAIVAKKSPNRTRIPYSSIRKPKKGQRKRMRAMPAAKAAVPFHFWRRAKKAAVFCTPIMRVRPIRKRIWRRPEVRTELCKVVVWME